MPAKSAGPERYPGDGLVGGHSEILSIKISFTADSLEQSKNLKGSDKATQIYCEILDIFNNAAISDTTADTDSPKYNGLTGGVTLYTIEFIDSLGGKAEYTLRGNVLCARPSGNKVILTDIQLSKLKTLLEITEK